MYSSLMQIVGLSGGRRPEGAAQKRPSAAEAGHRQAPQREPENIMSTENEIREIVSRYTRAADWRDGETLATLYEADAVVEIHYRGPSGMELLGTLSGGAQIAAAMSTAMAPHPPLGWSHHTTYDHLVS